MSISEETPSFSYVTNYYEINNDLLKVLGTVELHHRYPPGIYSFKVYAEVEKNNSEWSMSRARYHVDGGSYSKQQTNNQPSTSDNEEITKSSQVGKNGTASPFSGKESHRFSQTDQGSTSTDVQQGSQYATSNDVNIASNNQHPMERGPQHQYITKQANGQDNVTAGTQNNILSYCSSSVTETTSNNHYLTKQPTTNCNMCTSDNANNTNPSSITNVPTTDSHLGQGLHTRTGIKENENSSITDTHSQHANEYNTQAHNNIYGKNYYAENHNYSQIYTPSMSYNINPAHPINKNTSQPKQRTHPYTKQQARTIQPREQSQQSSSYFQHSTLQQPQLQRNNMYDPTLLLATHNNIQGNDGAQPQ